MPSASTSASPLSRMVSAMRVKSPFSQSAWFGFINVSSIAKRLTLAKVAAGDKSSGR